MRIREQRFLTGKRLRFRPVLPTVSVGNIGMGGSGKTPLTDWIVSALEKQGQRPAVLSRGYRAKPPERPYLVRPDSPVREAGDEPLMLARKHPDAVVITDPVRSRSAAMVQEEDMADVLVLDDGFQHMAVERDLDLVLLTEDDLGLGWNRVFPAGYWREPASALDRAQALLIKAASDEEAGDLLLLAEQRIPRPGLPVFSFRMELVGLRGVRNGMDTELSDDPYILISGIGDPGSLERSVAAGIGRAPAEHLIFRDHHGFTAGDWDRCAARMRTLGVQRILCTSKDATKLAPLADDSLLELRTELCFGPYARSHVPFPQWFFNALRARHPEHEVPDGQNQERQRP